MHDWVVECDINRSDFVYDSAYDELVQNVVFGLYTNNDAASLNGQAIYIVEQYHPVGQIGTKLAKREIRNSLAYNANPENDIFNISWPNSSRVTFSYSYSQNAVTIQVGSSTEAKETISSVRSIFGQQAYIGIWGDYTWNHKNGSATVAKAPSNVFVDITFKSMSMPHLEPDIEAPLVYPETGTIPYGKDAMIKDGATVRVECTVRNKYSSPGSEQYPVYLKTVNDTAHPTQGITPFIDSAHPLKVKQGSSVVSSATSANADTVIGANGTPITLVGSNEYTVTYYATVNQSSGAAIKLSQCLGENSFHGTYYATTELFSEKALVEGADYSRVPAANDNGWSNAPVTVEFNAGGSFDAFDVKVGGKVAATLTADSPRWTQSDDTDGLQIVYQAHNTSAGVSSTAKPDVIRIDSAAPTLTCDPVRNELVASDVAGDGADGAHATSGIWKIIRAEKQGQSVCAATDGRIYNAQGGAWSAVQTYTPLPGTYVAVDAAGNVSAPVEVMPLGAPSVSRPGAGGNNGGSGDGDDYAGPIFTGALPAGKVTVDGNGLNHRVIQEGVFEVVDGSIDKGDLPFGGTLDEDAARQLIDRNYSFASPVGAGSPIDVKVELIDARTGKPAGPVDTSKTGEYIVRATAIDAQGNTVTVEVACRFANRDDLPQVTPKPGTPNPDDIFGALIVDGDGSDDAQAPLEAKDVKLDEETGKVMGTVEASLYVPRTDIVATPDDIATLISNRYDVGSLIGGNGASIARGDVVLKDSKGNPIEGMDLSKAGTWTAEQTLTDGLGNVTTLRVEITNRKGGGGAGLLPDPPSIDITQTTDVRLDPESVGTVQGEPYFEHDADNPLNVLDAIQVRPEGAEEWSPIAGSGDGSGDGSEDGSGSDGQVPQLPDDVKVTVTDETGAQVDGTDIKDPGTYTVTVSVKDPDSGEYIVIETLTFHIVDTSITDTDYIYKDVAKDHWGHGYIFDIGPVVINGAFNPSDVALGYMAGYAGTTDFGPSNGIIRGDAAIVIWRMAGCPDVEGGEGQGEPRLLSLANAHYTGFTDCDSDPTAYYNKAIRWCAENGIVTGYKGTGEYRPQNKITREEFASIIARYASFKGKDVASADADLSQYPDIEAVSDWAAPNMQYVVANGIMTGKGTDEGTADGTHGILDPQADVTRAEVAKMIYMEQPMKP